MSATFYIAWGCARGWRYLGDVIGFAARRTRIPWVYRLAIRCYDNADPIYDHLNAELAARIAVLEQQRRLSA